MILNSNYFIHRQNGLLYADARKIQDKLTANGIKSEIVLDNQIGRVVLLSYHLYGLAPSARNEE